jgi:hypothetical protein
VSNLNEYAVKSMYDYLDGSQEGGASPSPTRTGGGGIYKYKRFDRKEYFQIREPQ